MALRIRLRKSQLALLPAAGGVRRWQNPGGSPQLSPLPQPPAGEPEFDRLMRDLHEGTGAVHLRDHEVPHVKAAVRHGLIQLHRSSTGLRRPPEWGPTEYTHHATLTDRGRRWMDERQAAREGEHGRRQVGLFKGRRPLRLVVSLRKAQQLGLFGPSKAAESTAKQIVTVHQHQRRAHTGAIAMVQQHLATRPKAVAEQEAPRAETDAEKAQRMREERTARDTAAEREKAEWIKETAARILRESQEPPPRPERAGEEVEQRTPHTEASAAREAEYRASNQRRLFFKDFDVPAQKLAALQEHVTTLNKKASKLGLPPITLEVSPEGVEHTSWVANVNVGGSNPTQPAEYEWRLFSSREAAEHSGDSVHQTSWMTHHVHVEGTAPKIPGFEFLAKLEHHEGGNIVKGLHPSAGAIPKAYLFADRKCEHCTTNRSRKDTYLVLDEEKGTVKQVGRTCLKEYMGTHRDPEKMAEAYEWLTGLDLGGYDARDGGGEYSPWEEGGEGKGPSTYPLRSWLGHVTQSMLDSKGFRRSSEDDSTAGDALERSAWGQKRTQPKPVSPAADDLAERVWKWGRDELVPRLDREAEGPGTGGGFLWNLGVLFRQGYVDWNTRGIAAAAVQAYQREKVAQAPKPERQIGAHVGTVGERRDFRATLERSVPYEGEWGSGSILLMRDADGNKLKAFHSGSTQVKDDPLHFAEPGRTYTVTGTVKKHGDYKGEPETQLSRVEFASGEAKHPHHAGPLKSADFQALKEAGALPGWMREQFGGSTLPDPMLVQGPRGQGTVYLGHLRQPNEEVVAGLRAHAGAGKDKTHKLAGKLADQIETAHAAYRAGLDTTMGPARAALRDGSWNHVTHAGPSPSGDLLVQSEAKRPDHWFVAAPHDRGYEVVRGWQGETEGKWNVRLVTPKAEGYGNDHIRLGTYETPAGAMQAIEDHHQSWVAGGGPEVAAGQARLRKGKAVAPTAGPGDGVRVAQVRGKGLARVRRLELPQRGHGLAGAVQPEAPPAAKPPTGRVKYRHPETGKERIAHVLAGGEHGITAIDDETGERHRLHHGHYVAHDPDEDGASEDEDDAGERR